MQLAPSNAATSGSDELIYRELPLANARLVELGCGGGEQTRKIQSYLASGQIFAYEVDRIQLAHNQNTPVNGIEFRYGGAESIDLAARSVDGVFMFKSLHHVPSEQLDQAMTEIHRVLKPGGFVYVSEPVFAGAFNEILRLFHNEQEVRRAAFNALVKAVDKGLFELSAEHFFLAPYHFDDFEHFAARIIHATHTEHHLDADTLAEVKRRFSTFEGSNGAHFEQPMRVDILHKPPAPN